MKAYTFKASVFSLLDGIIPGGAIVVEPMKDITGNVKPWGRVRMNIQKYKKEVGGEFATRVVDHGAALRIWRIE